MTVKILIKRRFRDASEKYVARVIAESRRNAMAEKGYISSESLCSCDDPNLIMVISMWASKEDWDNYENSPLRKETEKKYADFLAAPTEYEYFNLGLPFALSEHDFVEPMEF